MENKNPFIWHELVTIDPKKSGAFFSELFDWDVKEIDAGKFGAYTLFQKEGKDVAGMMNPTPDTRGKGSSWHSYIAVDNLDNCAKRAFDIGGKVLVLPQDVSDVGRICIVSDPTGAITHLMQPIESL